MIEIAQLTKRYGGHTAVDDVTFTCRAGQVTGFLGPNGAGKTTTMRVLTGLTRADGGTATIGGMSYRDIPDPGRHVGVLLDASAQHAGRTGREVLVLGARTMGLPVTRVDELLALVGLSETEAGRRIKDYSLGMRQRLGIAHALLGDPEVLVLDEPANGLDPAGIHWMRELLRSFADRGGTVLLSSHLLREVEVVADRLVVIGGGRVVADGGRDELVHGGGTFVRAESAEPLEAALSSAGLTATPRGAGFQVDAEPVVVGRAVAASGVPLVELRPADGGLEELFLRLTAETQREVAA
jgi:ABC-2 type transport system ATP-binding protein